MGVKFVDLDIPAAASERAGRLDRAREVLARAEERTGDTPDKARFDRAGYQRAYMRGWRARKRAK